VGKELTLQEVGKELTLQEAGKELTLQEVGKELTLQEADNLFQEVEDVAVVAVADTVAVTL
jgi:hypothetical protein